MIGDQHLLDRCFREARFNGYVVGEIHVSDSGLVPNSRRDDFVDNKLKNLFYNEVEKIIGLPMSKEIRLRSRMKSELVAKGKEELSVDVKVDSIRKFNSQRNEKHLSGNTVPVNENEQGENIVWSEMLKSCKSCSTFQKILESRVAD